MTVKTKKLDITARLETDEDIREFLREIAKTGGTCVLIHALNIAARAKDMTEIAKQVDIVRQVCTNLYRKTATRNSRPLLRLLKHWGGKLVVS